MAQNEVSHTCGTKKITYPAGSTFVCVCPANGKCTWTVILSDGTVFSGTELKSPTTPPKPPHVAIDGNLSLAAVAFQRVLKRRVVVPADLRNTKLSKKHFKGTAREVAAMLGLQVTTRPA
ncbi:MAG: hypothetical protein U0P30_13925 [Vicinamibacterales bacterium]